MTESFMVTITIDLPLEIINNLIVLAGILGVGYILYKIIRDP